MLDRLFAYGTLEDADLLKALCGRAYAARAAVLEGYRCGYLRRRRYPGVVACRGASTVGTLYEGLSQRALRRLDRYEGKMSAS